MYRRPARRAVPALVLAVALSAPSCTSADPPRPAPTAAGSSGTPSVATSETPAPSAPPPSVTVAFVEALDEEEAGDRVAPAFQGIRLAFSIAQVVGGLPLDVEVVAFDTDGESSRTAEVAAEVAATPQVVAAIAAPGLAAQGVLGDALEEAGVPWLSLSGVGSALEERGWTGWRRLVADDRTQGQVLGRTAGGLPTAAAGVCLLGDGTRAARELLDAAAAALPARPALQSIVSEDPAGVAAAVEAVAGTGCGVVAWGGDAARGAAIRRQLVEEGLMRVRFVGTDRIRNAAYLEGVGAAGEGTLATCPCVDVSTSTELAAQRFIQDYQSEYGLPPGPYAVEAWDAARILVAAFRTGAVTREDVRAALDGLSRFEGLAGTYRFADDGDLASPMRSVRLSRVEGGRWLQLERPAADA